eukprot:3015762-Rhodomonas_salina.1
MAEHKQGCLFALELKPHSAVVKTAPGSCDQGFELVATKPGSDLAKYAGTFKPGPSMLDDDQPGWFHMVNQPQDCITRIKQVKGKWVLSSKHIPGDSWTGPGTEKEVLKGSKAPKVDDANFNGFSMKPLPQMSWADKWEPAALAQDSVKLMYFGGMWCPYCPPFTEKLKAFFEIVRKEKGADALQVIFVSSDKSEDAMLEYFGGHHGEWFAVPHQLRDLKTALSNKHQVQGIPCLRVINNAGEKIKYFDDEEDGGEYSIASAIRKMPDDASAAKEAALEIFGRLQETCFPCPSTGLVRTDYWLIKQAVEQVREHEEEKTNIVGELKDLQTGKFKDAALGLRDKMGISSDWKEEEHCTVKGILAEVERLVDCSECAKKQEE